MKKIDLAGQKFGRLTVLERVQVTENRTAWRCVCECGNEIIVPTVRLTHGNTVSCGCYGRTWRTKHSMCKNGKHGRLYDVWVNMRSRCLSPKNKQYTNYGGRGIKVCDEWGDYMNFHNWAIANGYDENAKRGDCTLDRIDVNGNYEPSNCRWVTALKQNQNKRNSKYITFNGETKCVAEWARELGLKPRNIYYKMQRGITDPLELLQA